MPIAEAMDFISTMRGQLAQLKMQESSIRKGLNIFKIDQPPSHLIQAMEKVRFKYHCLYKCMCVCVQLCLCEEGYVGVYSFYAVS